MFRRSRGWTDEEIEILRKLYPTFTTFPDLLDKLPSRSPNSVRLMASRLGLRRPDLLHTADGKKKYSPSRINIGNNNLVKCSCCGEWFYSNSNFRNLEDMTCMRCRGFSTLTN